MTLRDTLGQGRVLLLYLYAGVLSGLLMGRESALRFYSPLSLLGGGAVYALGLRRLAKGLYLMFTGRKKRRRGETLYGENKEG